MARFPQLSRKEKHLFFSRLVVTLAVFATIATIQISLFIDKLEPYHFIIPVLFSSLIGSFIGWNTVLRHRLEKSDRIKSDFLASISHEFRTPLTIIIGFSKIMSEMDDLNIRGHEFAHRINLSGEHLLSFVNNILDISSIKSGNINLTITELNLTTLIEECVLLMSPVAEEAGITISSYLPEKKCKINADELRLKQVILNLLSNAIKYNIEHGRVFLRLEEVKLNHYRISIEDSGIGIPSRLHKKVFTQFERLEQGDSTVRGSGLGLTIAKHLMNLMGGELNFSSQQGVGSKFWIDFYNKEQVSPSLQLQ